MTREEILESLISMRKSDKIISIKTVKPDSSVSSIYSGGSSGIEPNFDFASLYPSSIRKINLRKLKLKDKLTKIINKL
jgi:hypothetical protein